MSLSDEDIKELKELYVREFGKTISDKEATEMGQRLVSLFKVIYRPIPGKDVPIDDPASG